MVVLWVGLFRRRKLEMIPYQRSRLVEPIHYYYSVVYLQHTKTHTHTDILSEIPIATLLPGLVLLYQLNTRVMIKARQGSIKPVPWWSSKYLSRPTPPHTKFLSSK